MNVLSLFDGISCARVALEKSGIDVDRYFASEIDADAIKIASKNYPDTFEIGSVSDIFGDIKKEKPDYLFVKNPQTLFGYPCFTSHYTGGIDLLVGGSPCQDLSIAKNNRKGLDGEKSGLFWEYVRVLREIKPKYFILENVASMPKEARDIISEMLGVQPIMINASLVSAQSRKRLFWTNIPDVVQPEDRNIYLKDILQPKNEVDQKYYIKQETLNNIHAKMMAGKPIAQAFRIRGIEGKSVTLSALGGGTGAKTGLYLIIPESTKKGYALASDGDAIDLSFPTSKTRRGRVGNKAKNLMTTCNISVWTEGAVRKLTPIECNRLQCLVDGYTSPASDNQQYKMCGNAFNVDVIAHILSFMPR